MQNPRLAARYAKSLIGLAEEQNQLGQVYADMKMVLGVAKTNPDFVSMLRSPVIAPEKKETILISIFENKVSAITLAFVRLLIRKTRESNLPEMAGAFIDQYNEKMGIYKVKVTTAMPMSNEMEAEILQKVKSNPRYQNIELETQVDESLIGGYKFEMGDVLIDASILRDLNDVRKQFRSNEYIHRIR